MNASVDVQSGHITISDTMDQGSKLHKSVTYSSQANFIRFHVDRFQGHVLLLRNRLPIRGLSFTRFKNRSSIPYNTRDNFIWVESDSPSRLEFLLFAWHHSRQIFVGSCLDSTIMDTQMEKSKHPDEGSVLSAVQLAVGGMTCVACVRTITDAVSELEGVSEISVNQLGKSASAVVARTALVDSMVALIEDIGYECQVISVMPINSADRSGLIGKTRTVTLEIKGMQSV